MLAGLTVVLPLIATLVILFYAFIQAMIAGGLDTQGGGFLLGMLVVFIAIAIVAAFAFVGLIKFLQNKIRGGLLARAIKLP